ncbi:MAG: DUF1232 domain-containing protein [Spirochaetales bacterium]|nr:DUF1232 domain-containing protein [Spirochaetales bacterium]
MPYDEASRVFFIIFFSLLSLMRLWFKTRSGWKWMLLSYRIEPFPALLIRVLAGIGLLYASVSIVYPSLFPSWFLQVPQWARTAGMMVQIGALLLLFTAHRALDGSFTTAPITKPGARLVRSGPYSLIRHPIYDAYLIIFLGTGMNTGNILFCLSGMAVMLYLMAFRLRNEEANLELTYGDAYRHYAETTGRFFPRRNQLSHWLMKMKRNIRHRMGILPYLLQSERLPLRTRVLAVLALGYFLSPIDLIPDFIPVLGQLDDAIILPLLIALTLKSVPRDLVFSCFKKSLRNPVRLQKRWWAAAGIVVFWAAVAGILLLMLSSAV